MNIYVGNISRTTTEQDLKEAFQAFSEVQSRRDLGRVYFCEFLIFSKACRPTIPGSSARNSPSDRIGEE